MRTKAGIPLSGLLQLPRQEMRTAWATKQEWWWRELVIRQDVFGETAEKALGLLA